MNCREFADFMNLYLDNELPLTDLALFDRHLELCPTCVAYLASYRQTIQLLNQLPHTPNMDEVPEELIQLLLNARLSSQSQK